VSERTNESLPPAVYGHGVHAMKVTTAENGAQVHAHASIRTRASARARTHTHTHTHTYT